MRSFASLGDALSQRSEEIADDFAKAYSCSLIRIPRPVDPAEVKRIVLPLLESLENALAPKERPDGRRGEPSTVLQAGHPELKEVEKAAGFIGARLGADEVGGFDVAALFTAMRDTLLALTAEVDRPSVAAFFEWLAFVALDALAEARVRGVREQVREDLESGTPVVMVSRDLPATLLVAEPDGIALDRVFGRLTMAIVRVGAKAVIVDVTGLKSPERPTVIDSLARFLCHRKISGQLCVLLVGLPESATSAWQSVADDASVELVAAHSFQDAVLRGLERTGARLISDH